MVKEITNEINRITNEIIKLYSPEKIILFGSCAKKQLLLKVMLTFVLLWIMNLKTDAEY